MPSKSPAQAKLMRAVAHGWKKPGGGPSRSVAKEFVAADKKVKGYQIGGGPIRSGSSGFGGLAQLMEQMKQKQDPDYDPFTEMYGTEPITGRRAKKLSGKEGIAGMVKAMTDLAKAGWRPGEGGKDIDFEKATFYPTEAILGGEDETSGLSGPAREGSIAEMLQTKYGITDPTGTDYDKYYNPADPYAHLNQPMQRQNVMWDAARAPAPEAGARAGPVSPRYPLSTDPVGQLREHKARIANILLAKEEDEPVEMQYGGLAGAGGLGQFARRAGGFPGGSRGVPGRQMMQQRGRGRGMPGRGRGMAQQMAQQRGRRGMPGRGGRGMPGLGGRGMPGGRQGMMQKQMSMGRRPQPGGMPPVQAGGPGGVVPGRQMLGASGPGGAGMPGSNLPPSLRGHLQKQRAMQRQTPGGNRVGMRDQQGGLARAMQTQTGRPPISRRAAFPGSRTNQY